MVITKSGALVHSSRVDDVSPPASLFGVSDQEIMPRRQEAQAAFIALYRNYFPFVWRSVRQLGVSLDELDDVVQEVFVVVHRRLSDFEGRSSMRTWLFGIARRVVADRRKSTRRKPATPMEPAVLEAIARSDRESEKLEAFDLVCKLLDGLDQTKREVFILAELEGMTMAEIAEATSANPNTVAARLRAARRAFEEALAAHEEDAP